MSSISVPPTLSIASAIIMDDEQEAREELKAALKDAVTTVHEIDGQVNLQRFLDSQPWTWFPSIIFVDLVLPTGSGYDVIRRLRERFYDRSIPIIVVSKMCTGEDILEAQAAGADAFIRKPYSSDRILTAARACLDNAAKLRTERRHSIAYYL